MYVYIKSEPGLFTVGHYDPNGQFVPESDHGEDELAAQRVNYLNGGKVVNLGSINSDLLNFVKRVAREPIGHTEASDREILDILTEEARALLSRVEGQ